MSLDGGRWRPGLNPGKKFLQISRLELDENSAPREPPKRQRGTDWSF
jgi:hypothetical protein